jgi:hypothetical protein
MTLSEKIQMPMFPLSIFLLPGERTQLHIFEPRYRQLFNEVESDKSNFGIPFIMGSEKGQMGSRCKLIRVLKRYNSGELDVLVESEVLFQLTEFNSMKEGKLYPYGTVILKKELSKELASLEVQEAYESLSKSLSGTEIPLHLNESPFTMTLMASLGHVSEIKYRFASLPSRDRRNEALLSMIKMIYLMVQQEKVAEQGIYLN